MTIDERYKKVIEYFENVMPNPKTELIYKSPYELMVAVILSAQCTDVRVNKITPAFFASFPNFESLAEASIDKVYELIKSCSYPHNKSKHLVNAAKKVVNEFGGILPDTQKAMQEIPGVGRKTANVLLSIIYNKPVIAVDTHVFRVANRIGLANGKTPLEVEKKLERRLPKNLLPKAHHWLILHGRYVCKKIKPRCANCGLKEICKYYLKQKN